MNEQAQNGDSGRRRFTIVLESLADPGDFTAFRQWLKACKRRFYLTCISIETDPPLEPIGTPHRERNPTVNTYTIFFDGLCEPVNPGGYGCYGFIIVDQHGEQVAQGGNCMDRTFQNGGITTPITNNVCEYAALIYALEKLDSLGLLTKDTALICKGDSKLVVEQTQGNWRINLSHLQLAVRKAQTLLAKAGSHHLVWIPREQNTIADQLSREAYKTRVGSYPPERKRKGGGK